MWMLTAADSFLVMMSRIDGKTRFSIGPTSLGIDDDKLSLVVTPRSGSHGTTAAGGGLGEV
jgi:hypothetical protein